MITPTFYFRGVLKINQNFLRLRAHSFNVGTFLSRSIASTFFNFPWRLFKIKIMAELFEDHGESFLYQNQAIFTQDRDRKIKNPSQPPPLTPTPHKTPLYSIALCNI